MKTNEIRIIIIRSVLLILLSLYFIVVFGQSPNVVSFNANRKAESISLQWVLAPSNNLSTVIIERKNADTSFQSIAEFWVNFEGNTERNFRFNDKNVKNKAAQYRLKVITANGEVQYTDIISSANETAKKVVKKTSAVTGSKQISKERNLLAVNTKPSTSISVDHLKSILLVQLVERENRYL